MPETADELLKRIAVQYRGTVFIDYDGGRVFARIAIGPDFEEKGEGDSIAYALTDLEDRLNSTGGPA